MSKTKHELFQLSQKVVLYDPAQKKFLLLKDAFTDGEFYDELGPWDLPGGRVHEREDMEDAVMREVAEEAGIVDFELKGVVNGCTLKVSTKEDRHRKAHHFYLGIYKQGEITVSDEHTEYRWVTLEEVEKDPEYKPWLKEAIRSAMVHIKAQEGASDTMRVLADFENYKKRQQESQKELGGYLIEKLVLDIIPVLDNFRAATMHVPEEQKQSPWVVGIQYIEKQLEDVVKSNGVEVIEAKEGDAFDPTIHEAVSHENEAKEDEKQMIAKVLQNGFRLGGKVIRPAKVTVS